ncbi:MAG: hypothetical protein RIR39_711 [Pseudomonadota bacterium]
MTTPSGYKNCEHLNFLFRFDLAHIAAMLWCGVPEEQVKDHLEHAKEIRPGIYDIEYMPCLKLRCQLIHTAIEQKNLSVCRENGIVVEAEDHVAKARRHVRHKDLKEWIALNFENDKPVFLFDETERNALPLIANNTEHLCSIPHQSDQLKILNQASERFWSNADQGDKETHPINKTVSDWLLEKGFSAISAQQGAAIIRPEWAAKGRRNTD